MREHDLILYEKIKEAIYEATGLNPRVQISGVTLKHPDVGYNVEIRLLCSDDQMEPIEEAIRAHQREYGRESVWT